MAAPQLAHSQIKLAATSERRDAESGRTDNRQHSSATGQRGHTHHTRHKHRPHGISKKPSSKLGWPHQRENAVPFQMRVMLSRDLDCEGLRCNFDHEI